jgi:hypothetical protein
MATAFMGIAFMGPMEKQGVDFERLCKASAFAQCKGGVKQWE